MQGAKTFVIIVIVVVLAGVGIYFAKNTSNSKKESDQIAQSSNNNVEPPVDQSKLIDTDLILFYGDTCPHCKKVKDFIQSNRIDQIIKFQELEVYNNKDNAQLMQEKQKNECKNLSEEDKGGVPFLYSKEKCAVGETDVMNILKEKAGIK